MRPRSNYHQSLSPSHKGEGGPRNLIGGERGFREGGGEGHDGWGRVKGEGRVSCG